MGTLQQIRKISPYVFGIFAVLLVAFFTIGDPTVIDGLREATGGSVSQVITEVNGERITYVDYETRVRDEIENLKRQQQGQEVADDPQLRQRVWDQMVEEILLKQEMEKIGIKITDEQIKEQMLDNPPEYITKMFSDSAGNFMRDVYLELITKPENYVNYMGADPSKIPIEEREAGINNFRKDIMNIEKYLRESLARQELQSVVTSGVATLSNEFTKLKYTEENASADVKFIAVTTRDVPQDAIQVKKEEIEKFYNENKHLFKQKNQRRLKYVAMPLMPSAEDSSKFNRRVNNILDDLEAVDTDEARDSVFDIKLSEYGGTNHDYTMVQDLDPNVYSYLAVLGNRKIAGPIQRADGIYFYRIDDRRVGESEVVKASHILLKSGPELNDDSLKTEASKILKSAKDNKEPFAILATKHSQDNGSASKGGDLGYFKKGMMVPEFEEAAFSAKVGDIVGPIKTQFGYHIIYVEDKRNEDIKYSEIKLSPTMSTATKTKLFRDAVSIQKQVQEGVPFDTVVARLKLTSQQSPFFEKGKAVLGSNYLAAISYDANLGDVLEPLELNRYGVVLAVLSDVKETGFKTLEDARTEISQRLGRRKQLDMAKARIEEIYKKVTSFGSISAAAAQDTELSALVKELPGYKPSGTIPGVGNDAGFAPKVMELPENKVNEPFRGEIGYYILEISNRVMPSKEKLASELPAYKSQLSQQSKGAIFYQWFQNVKEKAKIDDKRSQFYKEY